MWETLLVFFRCCWSKCCLALAKGIQRFRLYIRLFKLPPAWLWPNCLVHFNEDVRGGEDATPADNLGRLRRQQTFGAGRTVPTASRCPQTEEP